MAINNKRKQRKHIRSGGSYSSEELSSLTMNDGTTVVYSVNGDIKRPICGSIDVHKKILMAAVCKTDPETVGRHILLQKNAVYFDLSRLLNVTL